MTEYINVYRAIDATSVVFIAVVRCPSVRLFVTLVYRNGQTYYQTFSSPGGPIILVFQKRTRVPDCEITTGSPSTEAPNRGGVTGVPKFAIFNQYFRNTDTEYRTDMKKYRWKYRIPLPTPNTDTDPALPHSHSLSPCESQGRRVFLLN